MVEADSLIFSEVQNRTAIVFNTTLGPETPNVNLLSTSTYTTPASRAMKNILAAQTFPGVL